ncbi:MAG: PAS domain-containing protein [Anaeromyxobacter sp.]
MHQRAPSKIAGGGPAAATAPAGASPAVRRPAAWLVRHPELWIPCLYAVLSVAWVTLSDRLVLVETGTREQQALWSLVKGIGFVLTTAGLLALGIRRVLVRERRSVRALLERDQLLRAIAEAVPDPVFLRDRQGRFVFANQATLTLLGRPADEVIGRSVEEVHRDPALAPAILANDARILSSGRAETVEEWIGTPSGRRLVLSSKSPYRDPDGEIVGLLCNARDITDRKAAEERLRASEERLRLFVEDAPAALAMLDRELRYLATSQRWREDFGLGDRPLAGRPHAEVLPDAPAGWRGVFQRCLAGAVERSEEDAFQRPDGRTEWLRWEVHPWREAGGAVGGLLVHSELITRRREAERQLAEAAERLHQAQKLESVGRLAGGVAHDFNNLLTVILSASGALLDDLGGGRAASAEDVEEIRAAARRASDLTRQLLAFARKQVIAPEALDPDDAIRGAEKLLRRVLGEDIELRVLLGAGDWAIRCDPGQLGQVILNLALNARAAMPRGGALTIETRQVSGAPHQADAVAVVVTDTGEGMSSEVQAHIFEPFYTTKGPGEGTGLGLASVYGIVSQSGGQVTVQSAPGHGSTFELRFPRHHGRPVCTPAPPPPADVRGTEPVLVVEDDAQVREVTVRALKGGGYEVLVARDGAEALELFGKAARRPRLVVSDVVMPGLDGRAVADELRRRHGPVPVLFVSGYSQEVIAHHGVLDSGVAFLAKPFTPDALLARVRAALDASGAGEPMAAAQPIA